MVLDRLPYPVLCEINLSLSWSFSLDNERKVSHRPFQVELLVPPAKIKSELQFPHEHPQIDDSPYYVFVALCIVVIVISLIKIAASNENIECFREYFAVGYCAPDPSFL
jgi:hypothetical protein